jgi:cytochrome c peroxidase
MSAAKVALGRRLFYDVRLSLNRSMSCGSCHRQQLAFTDGRRRAIGATGQSHRRNTPTLANVAYAASLGWANAEIHRLADQHLIPMTNRNPIELGFDQVLDVRLVELNSDPIYRALIASSFDGSANLDLDRIAQAIASFVRTLISGNSAFDRLLYFDERDAMSAPAIRGMKLFFSERLGCAECHASFALSGPVTFEGAPATVPVFHNTGLYDLGAGSYPPDDTGLFELTNSREDMGSFRAPSLRNIELTAPYMHDGSIETLEGVIEHYERGGRLIASGPHAGDGSMNRYKRSRVGGFELGGEEKSELLAFLRALTDVQFIADPRFADPWVYD